jgi:Leucine-rich repeat (LRR) protein
MEFIQKYNLPGFKNVKSIEINPYYALWDKIKLNDILTYNELLDFRSKLPEISLKQFDNLDEFKMTANSELSESFFYSNSIKTLQLTNVKFSSRLKFNLPYLKNLTLSNVNCSSLNKSICNSINLEKLLLWNVKFKNLPDEISDLLKLKKITVYNKLQTIENIEFPNSLEEIDFRSNKLDIIPDRILQLPNLKYLDLACNNFAKFPNIQNNNLSQLNIYETPFGIFKSNVEEVKNKCKNSKVMGGRNGCYVEEKEKEGNYLTQTKKYYYVDEIDGTAHKRW